MTISVQDPVSTYVGDNSTKTFVGSKRLKSNFSSYGSNSVIVIYDARTPPINPKLFDPLNVVVAPAAPAARTLKVVKDVVPAVMRCLIDSC